MSETQNEYETEQETDAGITSGPWEVRDQDIVSGDYAVATVHGFAKDGTIEGNAALIAAAGTAAQEAKEMGYDPAEAVGGTDELLRHLEELISSLEEAHENAHPEGHMQGRRYGLAVDEAKDTLDALASAEGSSDE